MNVGTTFEANTQTAKAMEPGVSSFDYPAEFAETTAVFGTGPGDHRIDTSLAQSLTMWIGIIASVGIDDVWLSKRSAAHAANRRDRIDEGSNCVTSLRSHR